ncbi:MAG: hypothetical protein MUE74_06315 [Bacteroidales bacterium]|nr:hypothetical protein [Bacteroidales bacterium]
MEKVYSYTLSDETGVTSDQVRKDFSEFGITGNKRGGYDVDELIDKMEKIFHRNKDHNLVLIGMGNLGTSLSRLKEIIDRFRVKVAIIAVPEISAQEVTDELIQSGIKGIINFAPVLLKTPADVIVNNVNLCDELESVIYYVHNQMKSEGTKNLDLLYRGTKY